MMMTCKITPNRAATDELELCKLYQCSEESFDYVMAEMMFKRACSTASNLPLQDGKAPQDFQPQILSVEKVFNSTLFTKFETAAMLTIKKNIKNSADLPQIDYMGREIPPLNLDDMFQVLYLGTG